MNRLPAGSAVTLAVGLAVCAAAVWWWQSSVRLDHPERDDHAWERVRADYPITEPAPDVEPLSPELVSRVLKANPFSEQRQPVAVSSAPEAVAAQAITPQFVYKGRINLGQRQRAIIEETVSHKTYFLEVGQEVAGCKVLDITEGRVVLSDTKSHTEVVVSLSSASHPAPPSPPR